MALEGQQRIVAHHAASVVDDANQFAAARFHVNANPLRSRVERIFQQLLHYGRRSLHHFAGSDLVRHLIGKNADIAHKESIVGRLRDWFHAYSDRHGPSSSLLLDWNLSSFQQRKQIKAPARWTEETALCLWNAFQCQSESAETCTE